MQKTLSISKSNLSFKKLLAPAIVMLAFWLLGLTLWQTSGYLIPLFLFGYIGTALGIGLGLYAALPRARKPLGRRLALFLVGSFLFVFVALLGGENIQIEGVVFNLLGGVIQAAVMHFLIAKVFGPLLFGRLWCGWACWTGMILDLLPFQRSSGRLPGHWGKLRNIHFGLSLTLPLLLWFGLSYRGGGIGASGIAWFLGGNLLYYILGIGLAYALKDNRAFCKYLCPTSIPLKLTSRFSLLKVKGDAARCNSCQACTKACPMDIRIPDYMHAHQRVLSTECSLCQTCITVCPTESLQISAGFDLGGVEHLRQLPAAPVIEQANA